MGGGDQVFYIPQNNSSHSKFFLPRKVNPDSLPPRKRKEKVLILSFFCPILSPFLLVLYPIYISQNLPKHSRIQKGVSGIRLSQLLWCMVFLSVSRTTLQITKTQYTQLIQQCYYRWNTTNDDSIFIVHFALSLGQPFFTRL